ncbi:mannose-6-phosphate isomerase [Klebsiella pneumoniae]|nr:mannose-6-phosphate isomerase [Klebsiella pneumoniae]
MQSWSSKDFTADRAWGALDIANFFRYHRASALDRPTLYLAHQ